MKKILHSFVSVLLSNIFRLPHPYKLTFAITYHCNSRCKICNIWKKPLKTELSLIDIQHFFKKNSYFNWINLTGGEPTLRPDFVQIIKIILQTQSNLFFLNFPTNGLLTEKIVQNVKDILILQPPHILVSISLDGPEMLHDRLRGIKGNWKRAIKTYIELKKLRSKKFDCYFGLTISQHNHKKLEQTYFDLKKHIPTLKRSDIHLNIAHYSSHYYENIRQSISIPNETIDEIKKYNYKKEWTFTKIAIIEYLYQRYISKYIKTKKTPLPCKALSSSIFLDPYGNIFPCSMWNRPMGNIKTIHHDVKNIWNSKKTYHILQLIKQKKCPNCWTPCEANQTILGNLQKVLISK